MKLAFLSPGKPAVSRYETGDTLGIETQIWGNATVLASRGHLVTIMRRSSHDGTTRHPNGIVIQDLKTPSIGSEILMMFAFSRRCTDLFKDDGDTVAMLTERVTSFCFRHKRTPRVFTLHLSDGVLKLGSEDSVWGALTRIPKRILEYSALRSSDSIVVLTPQARGILGQLGISSEVIPNAIDPAELISGPDDGFFLYGGRLVRSKGIEYLLRAAKMLRTKHPELGIRIIGSGPDEPRLKKLTVALGLERVARFEPFATRKEYLRNVASCTAFVLPSIQEAFPVTVIEAMGSGKPVIVADVTGPGEIVSDGVDGFVVPPADVDGIARAMERLIENPNLGNDMGRRGKAKIVKRYTFAETAKYYERICKDLVARQ